MITEWGKQYMCGFEEIAESDPFFRKLVGPLLDRRHDMFDFHFSRMSDWYEMEEKPNLS